MSCCAGVLWPAASEDMPTTWTFDLADRLSLAGRAAFQPIGISCRICERLNCGQRAVPPLKRRQRVDPDMRAVLPYAIT